MAISQIVIIRRPRTVDQGGSDQGVCPLDVLPLDVLIMTSPVPSAASTLTFQE